MLNFVSEVAFASLRPLARGVVALAILAATTHDLGSQPVEVTFMAGRSTADAGYYDDGQIRLSSHGSRVALTAGVGARLEPWNRVAIASELRFVPRGNDFGGQWLNASYLDLALSGEFLLRDRTRIVRPFVSFGVSGGVLVRCVRGVLTSGGDRRDSCGDEGAIFPRVRRTHAAREIAFGIRFRTPPRDVDIELAHSRSLTQFQNDPTGLDAFHRVWSLRVRACVLNCRP